MVKLVDTSDSKSDWGDSVRVRFPLSVNLTFNWVYFMDSPVIIIDDDNRATKIKAFLESFSFTVFTAENLYELMGQIYKHDIRILIFNPDLVWVNAIEFITEFKKLKSINMDEYKIFFLCENTEKDIKEKARELNITCLDYPKNMTKLINHIKSFEKNIPI